MQGIRAACATTCRRSECQTLADLMNKAANWPANKQGRLAHRQQHPGANEGACTGGWWNGCLHNSRHIVSKGCSASQRPAIFLWTRLGCCNIKRRAARSNRFHTSTSALATATPDVTERRVRAASAAHASITHHDPAAASPAKVCHVFRANQGQGECCAWAAGGLLVVAGRTWYTENFTATLTAIGVLLAHRN